MNKYSKWLLNEIKELLPVFIFFFVALSFAHFTEIYRDKDNVVRYVTFSIIFIDSLLAAKVFFIVDHLPWIHFFSQKNIVLISFWKLFLYGIVTIIVSMLDNFIHTLFSIGSVSLACIAFFSKITSHAFWVTQLFIMVLLFIFVFGREFIRNANSG